LRPSRRGTRPSRPKREFDSPEHDPELAERLKVHVGERMAETILIKEKQERKTRMGTLRQEVLDSLGGDAEDLTKKLKGLFKDLETQELRRLIIEQGVRSDGRGLKDVRSITSRVSALPRTHGSALFTRGETQALVTVTLGTSQDEQRLDNLETRDFHKTFMLHYNFPPFCTGEVKPIRGPGRREIGHGALAERALRPVLPPHDQFPYTIRIVSEILESNGSSSMATVCGGSLALMDAGAPVRSAVAGIAMGLIQDEGRSFILTDILGQEDHLGDMDFKVAGTRKGVTAIQMDIKVQGGLTIEVMREALAQAREARLFVLDRMDEVLTEPRANLSAYAPRIITVRVPPARVRDVIGPGGKVVRGIVERTGVSIDIEDDGSITIASVDESAAQAAVAIIEDLTQEAEIGKIYHGTVKKIMDFGAFVEIFPGTDGLVHISQLAPGRVDKVTDVLNEGDEVDVKVLDVDRQGKIRLSRKDALSAEDRLTKS
jgi:polyribonucleotide nucleotidyltransferase